MSEHDQGPDEGVITRRTLMLGAGGAGIFGVLASRLYYLQVVKAEDYRVLSDDNRFNFKISLAVSRAHHGQIWRKPSREQTRL